MENSDRKFYITTPIYYVNDKPHIGHAYTTIVADTIARIHRQKGDAVQFLTGTDENSQKTVDAAIKNNEPVEEYTDRLAVAWQSAWQKIGISNTDFIRTTQKRHHEVVEGVWNSVEKKGDIYKGVYEGLYCTGCEDFKKPSDLVDGLCPLHKKAPEHIKEENYFFKLSKYQNELLEYYRSHESFVVPANRFSEVIAFVEAGLEDISISREGKKWGIPVPSDPHHVIYVWFDALINYISGIGLEAWRIHPADVQTVGKDILRFHAVIWPAMLLSAGLPLPKQIIANGFFTVSGEKISKSLGNAIDPLGLVEKYGTDAIRYFLLREIPLGDDGDFSYEKLEGRYNSDLANGIGNFSARVLALAAKKSPLAYTAVEDDIAHAIHDARATYESALAGYKFHDALASVWHLIAFGDKMINEKKPWEHDGDTHVITQLVLLLEAINTLLIPFLPEATKKIATCIVRDDSQKTITVHKGPVLFPRTDTA